MLASVIIPTHNRESSVLRLLENLQTQTMNSENYEVLLVDDGSSDSAINWENLKFPFEFHHIWQENQGATAARNHGALKSRGQILVFIDDDVTISENSLQALADACEGGTRVIALGSITAKSEDIESVYSRIASSPDQHLMYRYPESDYPVNFVECNTQVLAVSRDLFFELNMLQDPSGGWPNWDDVDFGYRAHQAGCQFVRVIDAKGVHWDSSLADLESTSMRWFRASKSAVRLFEKYPDLKGSIPMYEDKTPIRWGDDSPSLVIKKFIRKIASADSAVDLMKYIIGVLEKYIPEPGLLRPFYRWVCGAYMFQGFHQGLIEQADFHSAMAKPTQSK